jgi:hypothetical protein
MTSSHPKRASAREFRAGLIAAVAYYAAGAADFERQMERLSRHCSASQWRAARAYLEYVDDLLAETAVATTYQKERLLAKNDARPMRYPDAAEQEAHPVTSALRIAELVRELGGRGGMERARELFAGATQCAACERDDHAACACHLLFRDDSMPMARSKPCACPCRGGPR